MEIEEREKEFAELTAHALKVLEHAEDVEPRESIRHLGVSMWLWHYPAFDSYRSWIILVSRPEARQMSQPMVREATWNRAKDWTRINEFSQGFEEGFDREPSVIIRDAYLPIRGLKELLETGIELEVPEDTSPAPQAQAGERFGLEGYGPLRGVRLEWISDGPAEWRELTDWAARMRAFLRSCLSESG